jgi:V/A-type H+-transporting ATPase subunit I
MIAAMKKFILVLLDRDSHDAPLHLRTLGIAHVEKFESSGEHCASIENRLKRALDAKSLLVSSRDGKLMPPSPSGLDAAALVERTLALRDDIDVLQDSRAETRREADRIRSWGDFSPALITGLAASGLPLRLLEGLPRHLERIPDSVDFVRLPAPKGRVRILALGSDHEIPEFEELRLPETRLSDLETKAVEEEEALKEKKKALALLAPEAERIDREIRSLESALAIERIRSGMPGQESLRYLSGYVPAAEAVRLKAECARRGWALVLDEPADDEVPPTKVENNRFIRIIQPVFDFLGTVPGYREYDISPWFLGFFSIFFAMIFGDGGYGVLIFAFSLFLSLKAKRAGKPTGDFVKLLFLLAGTTTLWGLATGTWFALPVENLPGILQAGIVRIFASDNPEANTNIKIFCFILGLVQLSIAHVKNIRRDFPNPKFLAQVGSLLLVVGMFNAVLNLVVDASRFPLTMPALIMILVGFLLVLFLGNWNGNLLQSILEGLKNIITTFLGTVSVFADIVSYIRLWAVSLAGLAISQTVNGMVGKLVGQPGGRLLAFATGLVAGLGLLLAGHALNFIMTILSVIVHGIRLNMLEFSSHLGMEWTGYAYDPLKDNAEEIEDTGVTT